MDMKSKKKIIMVSHSAGNGGAERVSTLVANHMAEQGHEVTFYALHEDKRDYPLDSRITYEYCDVKGFNKQINQLVRGWKLKKYIKDNKIDVMIMFCYIEGIFLVGNHKVKKIYSLRNDPSTFYNKGIYKKLLFKIYRDADCVVFQTPDARDYFDQPIREHGVLIANPLKDNLPVWNKHEHSKEVIAVCRITKQKNLKMLIDAFKLVCQKRTDYKLAIYGQGAQKEELQEYTKSLGLENNVEFRGFINNVHEVMTNSNIYVSSSDYEGISNSMLEALAIGIPTICTDCPVGGARMFIESGKNGYLVPVGDSQAMAEKMLDLMENEELQMQFSDESRKIRETLSKEKIYGLWDKVVY